MLLQQVKLQLDLSGNGRYTPINTHSEKSKEIKIMCDESAVEESKPIVVLGTEADTVLIINETGTTLNTAKVIEEMKEKTLKFNLSLSRFDLAKLTMKNKATILLVDFCGVSTKGHEEKKNYLVHYLKIFCAIQKSPNVKCDYLIIGGDFNLDLDLFKEKKKFALEMLGLKYSLCTTESGTAKTCHKKDLVKCVF